MGPALDHHRHLAASRWRWPAPGSWARAIPTTCSPTAAKASARKPRSPASRPPTAPTHGDIRQGFVYERVPHVTLKSIANNAEIDVIWEKWQAELEPLRAAAQRRARQEPGRNGRSRARPTPTGRRGCEDAARRHGGRRASRGRRRSTPRSPRRPSVEYLYDKPYDDKPRVRVAGPFTVESLSPHRVLAVDEDDELIDELDAAEGRRAATPTAPQTDFADDGPRQPARPPACSRRTRRTRSTSPALHPLARRLHRRRGPLHGRRDGERRAAHLHRPGIRHRRRGPTSSPPRARPAMRASTC